MPSAFFKVRSCALTLHLSRFWVASIEKVA
jgi:hypothetical protein